MKKIIVAADIVPTENNFIYFEQADTNYLIGEKLETRFSEASFIIMNLEVPLIDTYSPIRKCGPCLVAPTKTIAGIKKINPYFFTLANNHILDQGVSGLESTINVLKQNDIDYSGVGDSVVSARKPFIKDVLGTRIGIYCCAEHEFSIAGSHSAGANPFDPLVSFDDVYALKFMCDYLIVLYHGGKEHYRYPSPKLKRVFHKFADSGADLVIAQHSHCIGCREIYNKSTLIYGQGNFLFDHSDSDYWKTSMLIEVELDSRNISYIPIVKHGNAVREASDAEWNNILVDFYKRSDEICSDDFVEQQYRNFALEMRSAYLQRFSGMFSSNLLVRVLSKISRQRFIESFYNDESRLAIQNVLDCEAHRELASEAMKSDSVIQG